MSPAAAGETTTAPFPPPELVAAALRERLRRGEKLEFPVVTGSMHPVVPTGARIGVEPVPDPADLRRFDILLFADGRRLVCHYLWHRNATAGGAAGALLVTRSLAGGEDLPFPTDRCVGRVITHRIPAARRARLVLSALGERWGRR